MARLTPELFQYTPKAFSMKWEFPTLRAPNVDLKKSGFQYKDTHQKDPAISRNIHASMVLTVGGRAHPKSQPWVLGGQAMAYHAMD